MTLTPIVRSTISLIYPARRDEKDFMIWIRKWILSLLNLNGMKRIIFLFNQNSIAVSANQANEISELDQAMDEAKTFDDFIQNRLIQDHYFEIASSFFGKKRFDRRSFDAIIQQMMTTTRQIPELKERLWSRLSTTEISQKFRISSFSPMASGRGLNLTLWRARRSLWLSDLRTQCGIGLNNDDLPAVGKKVESDLSRLADEINQMQVEINQAYPRQHKKARLEEMGRFYKGFSQDSRIQRAAAYYILNYLVQNQMNYFLEMEDADLILDFFKDLKQFPAKVLNPEKPIPKNIPLLSQIKAWTLDVNTLQADTLMFPFLSQNVKYPYGPKPQRETLFDTIRVRPFHGIWVGIIMGDCLGGSFENLHKLSPRRWTMGCLNEAQTYFFLDNNKFSGFTKLIPIKSPSGETYGSFSVAIPTIGRSIIPRTSQTEAPWKAHATSLVLFDVWFPKFLELIPKKWKGLLASESMVCDISQTKYTIWNSPHLYFSEELGPSSQFRLSDPIADRIVQLDSNPEVNQYGNGIIFDSFAIDSGNLRCLQPFPQIEMNTLRASINQKTLNPDMKKRTLNYAAYRNP